MAALVTGAALTLIAACGSSPGATPLTTYAPLPTTGTSPAPVTPAVGGDASSSAAAAPSGPSHTWTTTDNGSDGSVWTTSFTAGPMVTGVAINSLDPPDAALATGCQVDQQRDAVIPWILHTQSTTGNFTITTHAKLELADRYLTPENPAGTGESVEYAANFSDDTSCHTLDPTNPADEAAISVSNDQVASGQSTQLTGILVLSGWASPANPQGDVTFTHNVWLWIGDQEGDSSGQWTTASVTGPGVIDERSPTLDASSGWYFPIDGVTHPDCTDPRASDAQRARCERGAAR